MYIYTSLTKSLVARLLYNIYYYKPESSMPEMLHIGKCFTEMSWVWLLADSLLSRERRVFSNNLKPSFLTCDSWRQTTHAWCDLLLQREEITYKYVYTVHQLQCLSIFPRYLMVLYNNTYPQSSIYSTHAPTAKSWKKNTFCANNPGQNNHTAIFLLWTAPLLLPDSMALCIWWYG